METWEGPTEMFVAEDYMTVLDSRVLVPPDSLVVARFGLLPFYQEMERDLRYKDSVLLNSYAQHQWIANLLDWGGEHGVLAGMTPRTWTRWDRLPENMSFVVKGRTNSKKQSWNTRMFAPSRGAVPAIAKRLNDDENLCDQGIVAREYVPLKKLDEGLNGLPITNEWRFFFLNDPKTGTPVMLANGFYWMCSHPEAFEQASLSQIGVDVAKKAASLVSPHVPFFVIDVAETATEDWIVIEVNDAQMSGLCGVKADEFYKNLAAVLGSG